MDPQPTVNSELEKPETYYNESEREIDYSKFLADTIELESETPEIIEQAILLMESETQKFSTGGTTPDALKAVNEYLLSNGIDLKDPSRAYDMTVIRMLKSLKGTHELEYYERYENLYAVSLEYILEGPKRKFRSRLENGKTRDQHQRENNAAINIQRHVIKEELGLCLPYVRDLFLQYVQRVKQSQQD